MCRLYVLNKAYPVFDGYKLNTKKATIRYEFKSNAPISCKIRTLRTMKCECGNELVPLAYGYDDGLEKSRILLGRKCISCGKNYFTEKTISMYPQGFIVDDNIHESNDCEYQNEIMIKRGDIFFADLNGLENWCGSEQTGERPVFVIQNDKGNMFSNTIIVAIITSKIKKVEMPTHVRLPLDCMPQISEVHAEQIKTIDKRRLGNYINNVYSFDKKLMKRIDEAIKVSLGL